MNLVRAGYTSIPLPGHESAASSERAGFVLGSLTTLGPDRARLDGRIGDVVSVEWWMPPKGPALQ